MYFYNQDSGKKSGVHIKSHTGLLIREMDLQQCWEPRSLVAQSS